MSSKPSSQRTLDGLKWLGLSLVHHEPSSLALPRFGMASVDGTCVAVTYHAVHEQDGAFFFELDPFEKEPHVCVLGPLGLNHMDSQYLAQARSELVVCASLSDHGFSGAREEQARVVLQKMIEAQAAPGGLRYIPEGDLNNIQVERGVLRELSCHGLVFGVLQDRTTDASSRLSQCVLRHADAPMRPYRRCQTQRCACSGVRQSGPLGRVKATSRRWRLECEEQTHSTSDDFY